jgi:U-box domain
MDSISNDTVTLASRTGELREVPDEFICPITLSPMHRPLVTRTGLNFERTAILHWLQTSPSCPLTRQPLSLKDLIPNPALEAKLQTWLELNDIPSSVADEAMEKDLGANNVGFFGYLILPESAVLGKTKRQSQESSGSARRRYWAGMSRTSTRSRPRTLAARSG